MVGNALGSLDGRQAGKSIQITGGDHPLLDMIDVISHEAAPPIIEDQPETTAGMEGGGEIARNRIETEIQIPDRHRRPRLAGGSHVTAVAAIDAMNAIVKPPAQSVHVAVGHAEREPFQHHFAHVGLAVAVGVLQKNDLRRGGDQHSAAPGGDGSGETQPLGKEDTAVDFPVAIGVLEQTDRATGTAVRAEAVGVIAHLDHVQATLFVKGERHRIDHVRFTGEQGHFQRRMQFVAARPGRNAAASQSIRRPFVLRRGIARKILISSVD